ncbi:hypothetical protein ACFQJ7_03520 [Halovenus rubra]|uniref:Uncharacterized protein n=2 Tax=Halovenus rubra TaxID=869890 RepID=A0ACC7DX85_9EURY|nr:hypothetical protein [Halovenus rubra]
MDRSESRTVELTRVCVDAVSYAVVLTAVISVVAIILGIATGGGFVRGKIFLFVVGWLLMTLGSVKLWPSSRWKSDMPSRNLLSFSFGSDDEEPNQNHGTSDDARQLRESMQDATKGDDVLETLSDRDLSRFQQLVQTVPPNRWVHPPLPDNRITVGGKLFLASLLVFGVSFAMETYFGVV